MPLGQFGAFQIIPGDVRGLWVIRPDFTDEKVLFGCGTFCVARTPIPMADPASAAKFVLGRSLACCSELNKSPLLMQIHISSQLRSPAAAAPPHVALAALQCGCSMGDDAPVCDWAPSNPVGPRGNVGCRPRFWRLIARGKAASVPNQPVIDATCTRRRRAISAFMHMKTRFAPFDLQAAVLVAAGCAVACCNGQGKARGV